MDPRALRGATNRLGDAAAGGVSFALSFALALEANELRRWTLRRRGYAELGIVAGKSREECEFRFLSAWLDEMADKDYALRAVPGVGGRVRTAAESPSELVVGLFPRPGG